MFQAAFYLPGEMSIQKEQKKVEQKCVWHIVCCVRFLYNFVGILLNFVYSGGVLFDYVYFMFLQDFFMRVYCFLTGNVKDEELKYAMGKRSCVYNTWVWFSKLIKNLNFIANQG